MAIPVACSFERRIRFAENWRALLPALVFPAFFFLVWDSIFTELGVWGFNEKYLIGLKVLNLPIEEILFFIAIPYACLFTYEVLNYYVKKQFVEKALVRFSYVFLFLLVLLAMFSWDKKYTFYTVFFTSIFLLVHLFWLKRSYFPRIFFSYSFILIPLFIVNGILTGTGLEEQVVWYNDLENISIRMLTIPVEDLVYGFLLFGLNVTLFEEFRKT